MELNRQSHRNILLEIFNSALDAVSPENAISNCVSIKENILHVKDTRYDLGKYEDLFVVGAGKASAFMAKPMEEILGDRITGGIINVKHGHGADLKYCRINECGHPVPDESGVRGTREIFDLIERADEKTLVICLISGGGSALLPYPQTNISLDDLKNVNRILLECGAEIGEINSVRKHLSLSKGGQLSRTAYPANVLALIISDVIHNPLHIIASGPTVPDPGTFQSAIDILDKYNIEHSIPPRVMSRLQDGAKGLVPETPKPGDKKLSKTRNIIISDNAIALNAAKEKAAEMGFSTGILSSGIKGEARNAAKEIVSEMLKTLDMKEKSTPPRCLISGGETTVTLKGNGKGGRNTEFALAAAIEMDGVNELCLLSCGTDGTDGPTDAAGAFCDATTLSRAKKKGLDAAELLRNNDSYNFFAGIDDLIITGPTGTNVMDMQIAIVE